MDKSLFFTEIFFENLKKSSNEDILLFEDKLTVKDKFTLLLVPGALFKSSSRSFALDELNIKKNRYNINHETIEINDEVYSVKKGFIGKKDLSLIETLMLEHKELLGTVVVMQDELNTESPDCNKLNDSLNLLFTNLLEHLAKEDTYLYKDYLKNENLVDVINLYKDSMKLISETAITYYNKWKDQVNVYNLELFKEETISIFTVLGERITNEEEHFFPQLLSS